MNFFLSHGTKSQKSIKLMLLPVGKTQLMEHDALLGGPGRT